MTNHTALLRLSSLLLASSIVVPAATEAGPGSRPAWQEPRITYIDEPTPKAREIITWAVDQYREAGLQLPDLQISFPVLCDGKGALYHVGKGVIDFCRINKRRALHEFAHAWDDTSGAVDREAFLELRGLTVWWGGTGMRSSEQGAEHLAEIIAWGLMGSDPEDVPQFPKNSVAELTEAFSFLTGHRREPPLLLSPARTDLGHPLKMTLLRRRSDAQSR